MIRFEETDNPDANLSLTVSRSIYAGRTAFQAVEVFENPRFGRVLVLDGIVQTTEADEFVYHEMLVHPPMLAHGAAKRVLVIGGGDGGAIEEALKHPVEAVTMVEIDPQVIELCRAHLPSICGDAFDDRRLDLVIGDGVAFVADTGQCFDVILVDSTEPVGPGAVLFETPFYTDCRRCLAPGGILVTQNAVPFLQADVARDACARLKPLFADVTLYLAPVPSFIGGAMAFAWASDDRDARRTPVETLARRLAATGIETRYYTAEVHQAAFALPPYIAGLVG
ncbi:MAG: polyamine aminopropyltransferase [Proteobacteria bacterium]|nr:polyamine aminopropyltransferase [Pseudomonadota bacterium]